LSAKKMILKSIIIHYIFKSSKVIPPKNYLQTYTYIMMFLYYSLSLNISPVFV
jgi:hypothetical protein